MPFNNLCVKGYILRVRRHEVMVRFDRGRSGAADSAWCRGQFSLLTIGLGHPNVIAQPPLSTHPSRPPSNATCRRRRCSSARSRSRASSAARRAPAVAYWRGAVTGHLLQDTVDILACMRAAFGCGVSGAQRRRRGASIAPSDLITGMTVAPGVPGRLPCCQDSSSWVRSSRRRARCPTRRPSRPSRRMDRDPAGWSRRGWWHFRRWTSCGG